MDFEICSFIFPKFDDFKILFKILKTSNIPIVRKMTLYSKIIFQLKETVNIRINYTGLSKGRSFIMIKIHPVTSNAILDSTTFKIAILVNLIKKVLKIDKDIYIATIHKCVDTMYLMIDNSKVFTALIIISAIIFKPSSPI